MKPQLYLIKNTNETIEPLIENEEIWLSQKQLSALYNVPKQYVAKHISNMFLEGLLSKEKSMVMKNMTVLLRGRTYLTAFYNLDVVILLGFRLHSEEANEFRKWATEILREQFKIKFEKKLAEYRAQNENIKTQLQKTKEEKTISEQMLNDFFKPTDTEIRFNVMAKLCKFTLNNKPIGGLKLKDKCAELNIVGKTKPRLPNQIYISQGYFKVYYKRALNGVLNPATYITPKGQKWLYKKLYKHYNLEQIAA